jgi:hypothetical protein
MAFKEKWKKFLEETKLTEEEKEKYRNKKKTEVIVEFTEEDVKPQYSGFDPRQIRFGTALGIGIVSNIFFFLFIILAIYYRELFLQFGEPNPVLEAIAWSCEAAGFLLMAISVTIICVRVQDCKFTKKMMILYLFVESIVMFLDFKFIDTPWFDTFSIPLIIGHAIFSALACYSYSAFDPYSKLYKFFVILASMISLGGMLWLVFGYQIYFSVLTNCGAYLMLFIATSMLYRLEIIEVPCNGDPVNVVETKSIFFE